MTIGYEFVKIAKHWIIRAQFFAKFDLPPPHPASLR